MNKSIEHIKLIVKTYIRRKSFHKHHEKFRETFSSFSVHGKQQYVEQ